MNSFEQGFMHEMEKRAQSIRGMADVLNAVANIKTVGDMTNAALSESLGEERKPKAEQKKQKTRKLRMSVDKDLLAKLTPEQRKQLFFAVRGIKAQ